MQRAASIRLAMTAGIPRDQHIYRGLLRHDLGIVALRRMLDSAARWRHAEHPRSHARGWSWSRLRHQQVQAMRYGRFLLGWSRAPALRREGDADEV